MLELRVWATRILSADTLEEKLLAPTKLTDTNPGPIQKWNEPTRPVGMQFQKHTRKDKLPSLHELSDPDKRAICLHRFAGHELLAVEIMAYALLAFPAAPGHLRRGIANTLKEEQEHVRLYIIEMERLGLKFGDLPLFKHFWAYTPHLLTPTTYVSTMCLTFEMANLDFAPLYGATFDKVGDESASRLMKRILQDEIAHVKFGWSWLCKLKKEGTSEWEAWIESLADNLTPTRSMGPHFQEAHRRAAGIPDEWIDNFKGLASSP